jgi:large subunit ribosomal protein L10
MEVKHLANLPSKQELLAKVVGSIKAPVSGFVGVLSGNLRKFVYALNAIKEAKEAK